MKRFDRFYFEKQYGIGKPERRQPLARRLMNKISSSAQEEEIRLRFLNPLPCGKMLTNAIIKAWNM